MGKILDVKLRLIGCAGRLEGLRLADEDCRRSLGRISED